MGSFEFLCLFRFEFCLRTSEAYSSFLNCFYFYFPFPSVCSKRIVLQIIVVLQLFYLLLFCLLLLPTRRGKNALLLYLENANAPIDTGLSEDIIYKIVYGLTMFP